MGYFVARFAGNNPIDSDFFYVRTCHLCDCGFDSICQCSFFDSSSSVLYLDYSGYTALSSVIIVFYGLPHVGILIDPFVAAVVVFSINEGAYCSETMRAALESVPKGQLEAGLCAGMSWTQTIRRIVLPQAFRTAFPTLGNSLISMVKDTSLAANITVTEMFMTTQRIVARTYEPLLLYVEVGLIYLIFCTVLTKLQTAGEKRLQRYGKR